MARKKRRKKKLKKRVRRSRHRNVYVTRQDSLMSINKKLRRLDEMRRKDFFKDKYYEDDTRKRRNDRLKRYDPVRYAQRHLRSRVKPTFMYSYQNVRDYLRGREDLICQRRKERRESLFARRNIGVGYRVNKLRNYTIDSLINCRRR